jgi:hydrogenase nickel incorporation protein HypB
MQVQLVENVLRLNDEVAAINRQRLREAGCFTVDLMGAPGCGKTTLIEQTLQRLAGRLRTGVIVGDLATQRDGDRMARYTEQVVQVNTGRGCHLEAHHVRQALSRLDLSRLDLLIIENVGNMICPVGFDLGQDLKVGMFCVSGGDDKAAKHPYLVRESDLLLLSKIDLLPHVRFDIERFREDVRELNPVAQMLELNLTAGDGIGPWVQWLTARAHPAATPAAG